MVIRTERLDIVALDPQMLHKWLYDITSLADELCCKYDSTPMEGDFREIVKMQYEATKADEENYVWHSFFLLIKRAEKGKNVIVGAADFKDVPDENGNVEIGYGLGSKYLHNGYMTEAVRALCGFAFSDLRVKHVTAETESDGYASQKILTRCGFTKMSEGESYWWRLDK